MTDSVLSPGTGQACSSKAQTFPAFQAKTSQFNFHAAVTLCREDWGDGEPGASVSYPQPLAGEAALDSVVVQQGRDSGPGASALIFFRGAVCCFCGYVATWSVRYKQAFASRLVLKWPDRHQYSIMGLLLIFLWRLFLSLTFGVITIVLVQCFRQKGDTSQREYTHTYTEGLRVEKAYHEHRPPWEGS